MRPSTGRFLALGITAMAVAAAQPGSAGGGEKVYVGAPCRVADRDSLDDVDHSALDARCHWSLLHFVTIHSCH